MWTEVLLRALNGTKEPAKIERTENASDTNICSKNKETAWCERSGQGRAYGRKWELLF